MSRIVVMPNKGMWLTTDMLLVTDEMLREGHQVTLLVRSGAIIKGITKYFERKNCKVPNFVLWNTKKAERMQKHADIVLTEVNRQGIQPLRKHQHVVSMEDLFDKHKHVRPIYDILKRTVAEKEALANLLMRDGVHFQNKKTYFMHLNTSNIDGNKPEDYAGVSYMACGLMELDNRMHDEELIFFEVPNEYKDVLRANSWVHIKQVPRRVLPEEVIPLVDGLITDNEAYANGYSTLCKKAVINWTLSDIDGVLKKMRALPVSENKDVKISSIGNTKLYTDSILG